MQTVTTTTTTTTTTTPLPTGPCCYLICLSRPYTAKTGKAQKQFRHYIGRTKDLPNRLHLHMTGQGSKTLRAAVHAGIGFDVVRTWANGTHDMEKRLKRRHRPAEFCPHCAAAAAEARRAARQQKKAA